MAQQIKLKRSAVAGKVPSTSSLATGELAINTADGKLYFVRDDSTIQTIVTTNAVVTGSVNINGPITGSDIKINQWGSISASLSTISSQAATVPTLDQVTDQGSSTTNFIEVGSISALTPGGFIAGVFQTTDGPNIVVLESTGTGGTNPGSTTLQFRDSKGTQKNGAITYGGNAGDYLRLNTSAGTVFGITGSGVNSTYVFTGNNSGTGSFSWDLDTTFIQKTGGGTTQFLGNATTATSAATASSANSFTVRTALTASGLHYPTADGAFEGQVLQTNAAGTLSFADPTTIYEIIRNGETTTIVKGTPVYVSGSQGANPIVYRADAADPAKMPVTYIVSEDIATASTGRGIVLGIISGIDLTGYTAGQDVYVAPGGGWTITRPTGSAIVQLLGIVSKPGNGGKGLVLNPGPATLPNLTSGNAWVGNSTSYPVAVPTASFFVTQAVSASFAATATTASFALTASSVGVLNQDVVITGSITTQGPITADGNVTITGSLSILGSTTFTSVTSSNLVVDDNLIFVNAAVGSGSQFAGLAIIDTEDINSTASFLWDSINHYWIESVPTHELGYSSSLFILGPETTGPLGTEIQLTDNRIPVARGGHHIYDSNITSTGSYVGIDANTAITGSLTVSSTSTFQNSVSIVGNLTVFGTSSFTYVTSSQLNVDDSFISVNVFEPVERFGGIKVYDSGSSTATASLAWDSQHNHWVYQNASGSTYTGGMFLSGPRNTGSLGDEPNLAKWYVPRSDGGDHLDNSQIYSSGSVTKITGSLTTSGKVNIETVDNYGSDPDKFLALTGTEVVYRTGAQLLSDIGGQTAGTFVQNAGGGGQARYIMRYEDSNSATTSSIYEDTSGNIGINKTTPGANLDVNGSAIVTGSLNVSGTGYFAGITSSGDIQVNELTVGRGRGSDFTNVALGVDALRGATTGFVLPLYSVAVGNRALCSVKQGINNAAVGKDALYALRDGNANTGIGNGAGSAIYDGSNNTAIGSDALITVTDGNDNTVLGQHSLFGLTTGNNNIGIGSNVAGPTTGENNTIIGTNVSAGNVSNNIILGTGDGSIKYRYANNNTTISGSLSVQGSTTVVQQGILVSGTTSLTVASISTGSYEGAFLDYVIASGSNKRAGTLTTVWTPSDIEWNDASTLDLGSTVGAEFTPTLAGSNANLVLAVPTGTWTVKGHLRYM